MHRVADAAQQLHAIGPLEELAPALQRAFSAGHDFEPVPEPGPADWLSVARERGQSFERFTHEAPPPGAQPAADAQRIYLRPIGEFPADYDSLLKDLERFGREF